MFTTAHDDYLDRTLALHEDAQIASIVWAKLLPSFSGTVVCHASSYISRRVMSRSLALIHSATPSSAPS